MAKVLIVDDSKFQRSFITRALEEEGHEVLPAENGEMGLDMFGKNNPDCILCDLNMPEMDGYELIRKVREKDKNIPIIIVSSDTQELTHNKCMELGATELINKPFKKENLLKMIARVVSERQK